MDINKRNRTELKSYFVKNAIPTENNFADLIEGALNQKDDGIVKLPGNPLSIEAAGDATSLKKAINFYQNFNDTNPDWTINLNPRIDPNNASTAKVGFNISDGEGSSRLFIDRSTGNVGVGTTSPEAKLEVVGDIYAGNSDIYFTKTDHSHTGKGNTAGYAAIENAKNYDALMILGRAGTSKGRYVRLWDYLQVNGGMDVTGNVSIGVAGSLSFDNRVRQMLNLWSTEYGIGIQSSTQYFRTAKNFAWYKGGTHNDAELSTGGGTVQMVIQDGSVGIGTTTINPGAKLQVAGGAIIPAPGNAETAGIMFPKDPGGGGGDAAWIRYYAREGEKTTFEIGTSNDADDHIALMASGNVGIGTTTPGAKLEVNATSTTHGGWLEAIRFSRTEHSAITHPGGGLLFGLHGNRNFYFGDIKDGFKKYVMVINANTGNVGLGIDPSEKRLHIEAGELRVRASHNNTTPDIGAFYAQNLTQGIGIGYNRIQAIGSNAAQEVHIMAKGNAGVFLRTGGDRFVVMQGDGNLVVYDSAGRALWASGTSISDARLKENIHSIDDALAKVVQLRGVSFSWKDKKMGDDEEIGLVAQEVETVVPYLVHSVDQKTKMVRYEKCVPLLVEAIKEQQARIDQLRDEIQLLKA